MREPTLPLFLCPNDNSQMQKITREGVDIDICPSCKGIWLDRGELDKLLVSEREESEKSMQAHRRFQSEVKSFEQNPDDYTMDHSANIAVLGPDGKMAGFIKPPFNPKAIAEDMALLTRATQP
jgi:Zn-finger nucleic acid-binding protein